MATKTRRATHKVRIEFQGYVDVDIKADPDDGEAWTDAIAAAWAAVGLSELSEAAEAIGHEIVS